MHFCVKPSSQATIILFSTSTKQEKYIFCERELIALLSSIGATLYVFDIMLWNFFKFQQTGNSVFYETWLNIEHTRKTITNI